MDTEDARSGAPPALQKELPPPQARVLVVGAVRLYREGIAECLRGRSGIEIVGAHAPTEDLLALVSTTRAQVALIDAEAPRALEHVRALARAHPPVAVVAFAVSQPIEGVVALAEAGMSAYVPADATMDELHETMIRLARGEVVCSPLVTAALLRRLGSLAAERTGAESGGDLTVREREIAELIARGLSNKAIARRLSIRLTTVKNHVHHILAKLGVERRTEAAARVHGVRADGARIEAVAPRPSRRARTRTAWSAPSPLDSSS